MRRLIALAVTMLVVTSVVWTSPSLPASRPTALALGFALIAAALAGELLERLRLPRVTGYLLFGVLIGPSLGNVVTASMAGQLQFVTGIATTIIALIAGLTLNIDRLGWRFMPIVRMTAFTLLVPMVGLVVVGWLVWPWLPIAPDANGLARLAMVALVVTMVVSFSLSLVT